MQKALLGLVIIVRRVGQYVIRTIFVHIRAATINKQIAITINRFLDSTIKSTRILIVGQKIWKLFLKCVFKYFPKMHLIRNAESWRICQCGGMGGWKMIEDIEMYIYWTTFANMHYDQRRLPVLDTVIWQIENEISHLNHQAQTLHSSTKN